MYILGFIKKSSPPQLSKNRKIKIISGSEVTYTEINPAEYFNNTEYPFIYIDGDKSNYKPGVSSSFDHGYYILYDNNKTNNERRFYTYVGWEGWPVDIRYSTEINKWILIDDGKQDGGIMEAESLKGPWIEGKYASSDVSHVIPTPIPLSSIEAMFKIDDPSSENEFLLFLKNTETTQNMYGFTFSKRNGVGLNDYNGLSIDPHYLFSPNVNINELTKENPIRITVDFIIGDTLGWNQTYDATITLLEE